MTKEDTSERVVRFLIDHASCTDCASAYHSEDVHVLAHRDERVWELAAVCHNCYTLSLIRAVIKPRDHEVAATATARRSLHELTDAEARRFRRLTPLVEDDVLDVASFLSGFDGDFRGLFGSEPDES